ncbi:MAG: ornithine cyclodeaminase family protein [Thermoguttaceae bacterium]|jgi:ornithine cyclodeaminase/alanine dehydrogenase-like protein (mu-crystallin family)
MNTTPLLYLAAAHVRRALPMTDAIAAMRDAFAQLSSGQVTLPTRECLQTPDGLGASLVMPCHSTVLRMFSLKTVTVFPDNPRRGLPTIQSLVILTDGTSGAHLAVMDGASLTAIRTGATSGLATDLLARLDAAAVTVFGAGVQARTQLEAVCCVRTIRRACVYDPVPSAADRFAAEMTERLGRPVTRAASPVEALKDADVVCTATTASDPLFEDSDLKHGAHINAIGSYRPHVSEIPPATVCRARVVVDHLGSALEEAGDLLRPLRQGLIEQAHFATELGDVVLGRSPGRGHADQITLFKSVGVAIQDLCAAAKTLENARRLELGLQLS